MNRESIWAPELSARFFGPFMDGIVARSGRDELRRFLDRWQISLPDLSDETAWVSLRFAEEFVEALVELFGTETLVDCARRSTSPRYFGFLYPFLRLFASPRALYSGLPDFSKRFNKVNQIRILERGLAYLKVAYAPTLPHFRERSPLICLARRAQLSAGPTLWGLPYARVVELSCQARGQDECVYEIRWQNRIPGTGAILGLVAGLGAGFLLPLGIPTGMALVGLGLSGVLLGRVVDQQRLLAETRRFSGEQHQALEASALATERRFQELQAAKTEVEQRVQDRTWELQEVNRKLAHANEDLKELDQVKSRFFANISHELRTPLTLILAPLESMLLGEMGPMSKDMQRQFRLIRLNALRLLKLINNLLDLSRLEESRIKLDLQPLNLATFVSRLVEQAMPLARRQTIDLGFERGASPVVMADLEKLERVLINLLANALKFTDPGGRVLVVVGETQKNAWVAVQDSGIGIPEAELPHIFDRFRQVDPSSTRRHGGTGIGLALAKELAELHGGRITVKSVLGEGSTFTLNLHRLPDDEAAKVLPRSRVDSSETLGDDPRSPSGAWTSQLLTRSEFRYLDILDTSSVELDEPPRVAPPEAMHGRLPPDELERRIAELPDIVNDMRSAFDEGTPVNEPGASSRPLVLVVEDNLELLQVMAQLLGRRFRVQTAVNGQQGLELARKEMPQLVLCDMMMPVMDGLALCRELRQDARTAPIPVLMITARTASEDSVAALDSGADDFISKPFSLRELMARINAQLRIRQLDQAVARADRMASLGHTAAGLAHEVRNALNPIVNGLEALDEVEEPAAREELMHHMQGAAQRILDTINALTSFVRLGESQARPTDLNQAIRDTITLNAHKLRGLTVDCQLELKDEVECFPATINQVLMNLLNNAAEAAGDGGRIHIHTRRKDSCAQIIIKDNGPGVLAEDRERIFHPYFTTKPVGQGTGLGLPIARQIVERHGGSLKVTSPPGQGAEFTLEVPLRPVS